MPQFADTKGSALAVRPALSCYLSKYRISHSMALAIRMPPTHQTALPHS
jgi:hypothetical protein